MTAADPNWNSVVLMVHGDSFVDTVTNAAGTLVGTPTIESTPSLFGSDSLSCTPGNYLTFPDSAKWDLGTSDFTVEFSIYFTDAPTNRKILGQYAASGAGWWILTDTYGSMLLRYTDGSNTYNGYPTNVTLSAGQWYRVAVNRSVGSMAVFLDGTRNSYVNYNFNYNLSGSTSVMSIGPDVDACFSEVRITKGYSRIGGAYTYTLATEAFPDADHPQYREALADTVVAQDGSYAGPGSLLFDNLTEALVILEVKNTVEKPAVNDTIYASDVAMPGGSYDLFDTLRISDSTATISATALRDVVRGNDLLESQGAFGAALLDTLRTLDTAQISLSVAVDDPITLAWALGVVQGSQIAEQLRISEVLNFPVQFGLSVADTMRVYDSLRNFFNFDVADTITVADATDALARHIAMLSEAITAAEAVTPYFLLSATAHDDAVLDDAFDLSMIFQPVVLEQIRISALLVDPSGDVTSWTVNTRTGAVTEYTGYAFNSFAQNRRHYLGASETGLYQLDGDDDAGEPIIAQLRSGYAQFGGSRYTSFKAAYLGIRGDGSVFLKLDTGDGKSYTYKSVVQDQQSTKVRFGKGLRARYFAFELTSEGQDFDLDTVEFLPVVAQRRV